LKVFDHKILLGSLRVSELSVKVNSSEYLFVAARCRSSSENCYVI